MKKFIWLLVLILSVGVASSASAQKFMKEFDKPMPPVEVLPKEDFYKASTLYEESQFEDRALKFRVRLPTDWVKSPDVGDMNLKVARGVPSDLSRYFGPASIDKERQRLYVQASRLSHQMDAETWLVQYLLANKFSLLGFEVQDRSRAEALYVVIEDKISYVVRSVAQLNGSKLLFAQHFVPLDNWHDHKVLQNRALDSFQVIEPVEEYAEDMAVYPFADVALVNFPVTWSMRSPKVQSADRARVQILRVMEVEDEYDRVTNTLEGQVEIEFVSRIVADELDEEVAKYDDTLAEKGLVMGSLIGTDEEMIFHDFVEFAHTDIYEAKDNANSLIDYEFWVTMMGTEDHYVFITLLTPARDTDFASWIRNTETYKLVAQNMEPQPLE